jgi:hypothetical protein
MRSKPPEKSSSQRTGARGAGAGGTGVLGLEGMVVGSVGVVMEEKSAAPE